MIAVPTLGPGEALLRLNARGVVCGLPELRALMDAGHIESVPSNLGPRPVEESLDAWLKAHVKRYRRARKPKPPEGLVYLIRVGPLTKIGHTTGPLERRLRPLRTMNAGHVHVRQTHQGDRRLESALHREFAENRDHGEWFQMPIGWQRRVRLVVADYILAHVA